MLSTILGWSNSNLKVGFLILMLLLLICLANRAFQTTSYQFPTLVYGGDELLVVFMDNMPNNSIIQPYFESAAAPQNLRFMFFKEAPKYRADVLTVRYKSKVFEKFVLATTTAMDPVKHFDILVREALERGDNIIVSHRNVESMKFMDRSKLTTTLQRCVVGAKSAYDGKPRSFNLPNRRCLMMRPVMTEILEHWSNDIYFDIFLADVTERMKWRILRAPSCVVTSALGSQGSQCSNALSAEVLRLYLVGAFLLTRKHPNNGFFNLSSDLEMVHAT